jgi:hypothetical protein
MRSISELKSELDKSQKTLNERYDKMRRILKVLDTFNVTDNDLRRLFPETFDRRPVCGIAEALEFYDRTIDEAISLCEILESIDKPKRWHFRKPPTDELTKGILDQLLIKYETIMS